MAGDRRFVGFGFGAIQSGLFLYEALRSGSFGVFTAAEVDAELVAALRGNAGRLTVNIARRDGVTAAELGPVDLLDPTCAEDRELLIERVAAADEAATAVPSVTFYRGGEKSIAWIIAHALERRTHPAPLIIYAAENHNRAAEILTGDIAACGCPGADRAVCLNTVIGKMSGVVRGRTSIALQGLAPVVPGWDRAFLVESFNRILVSRPPRGRRAIPVFAEKDDLLPFEEAKLYGHNAAHAVLGFLAAEYGLERMAETRNVEGLIPFVRDAFVRESGAALIATYRNRDELFTPDGFTAYADDLLDRMTRASLNDAVERVVRDPERKLGYEDRLVGTLRLCRAVGGAGDRFAFSTACAFDRLRPGNNRRTDIYEALAAIWSREDPALREPLARQWLRFLAWREKGRPPLAAFWASAEQEDEREASTPPKTAPKEDTWRTR